MKYARASITIPADLLKRVDVAARALSLNRSEFIARTMQDALVEGEFVIKAMADDQIRSAMLGAMMRPGVLNGIMREMGQELSQAQQQKVLKFMKGAEKATH